MRGLYAIVDTDTLSREGLGVVEFARAIVRARPAALQLRAKGLPSGATLKLLHELRVVTTEARVPLFANDRPDLALLAHCDGVHLGQEDLPFAEVRATFPGLKIGLSTHDWPELEEALRWRPDYVAFGPVWATGSKRAADPAVGPTRTREAARFARRQGVPLVAIGAIDLTRLAELLPDVESVAMIGALARVAPSTESTSTALTGAGSTGNSAKSRAVTELAQQVMMAWRP